jgi:glutaredoxin-related protein
MKFLMDQMAFTVPQVFVGDQRVGGYEATVEAIVSGEFDRLLEQSERQASASANGEG